MDDKKVAMNTSVVSIVVNVVLSAFKLFAGIFAKSSAMVSDAVHSASDIFSTIVVMAGVHAASKDADKRHPYGHERMECVAAGFLAAVLAATGIGIGYMGVPADHTRCRGDTGNTRRDCVDRGSGFYRDKRMDVPIYKDTGEAY